MTDERAVRALVDVVAVETVAPGLVRVTTWSDTYHIDARGAGCNCPDKEYNDAGRCKHEHAVILTDYDHLPTPYLTNTEDRPTALADGGEACEDCEALPGVWPCARCYSDPETEVPLGPYA